MGRHTSFPITVTTKQGAGKPPRVLVGSVDRPSHDAHGNLSMHRFFESLVQEAPCALKDKY